jgi:FAD/FMN-containing dehydrogenase
VVLFPVGTEDVSAAIINQTAAAAAAGGVSVKIRASHRNFHSTSPFTCPGKSSNMYATTGADTSNSSTASTRTVTLLLDNMTNVLLVDKEKRLVRAQAGMFISKLLKVAGDNEMSVPLGSIPQFGDLTLGGVLLTGAHGSGLNKTSSLVRPAGQHSRQYLFHREHDATPAAGYASTAATAGC